MPAIEEEIGLSHAGAGSLFFIISIGYCAALLATSYLSAGLSHRGVILLSALLVGLSLIAVSRSRTLPEIRFCLFLLGVSAGIYLPSGISALTQSVSPRHWGKAIAIHELAPNLGFVAAPLVAEVMLHCCSWRGCLSGIGAAALSFGLLYALFGKGGRFRGETPSAGNIRAVLSSPRFWFMTALFGLAIGSSLGLFKMLPLYLVAERGFDRSWANTLISFSRVSGVFMALAAGWAVDRLGPRSTLSAVLLMVGSMTVGLGVAPGNGLVPFIFLQPLVVVCFFPAGFAAITKLSPPAMRNLTVSLAILFAYLIGGGLVPAGIGLAGDLCAFSPAIVLLGAVTASSALLVRRFMR